MFESLPAISRTLYLYVPARVNSTLLNCAIPASSEFTVCFVPGAPLRGVISNWYPLTVLELCSNCFLARN